MVEKNIFPVLIFLQCLWKVDIWFRMSDVGLWKQPQLCTLEIMEVFVKLLLFLELELDLVSRPPFWC